MNGTSATSALKLSQEARNTGNANASNEPRFYWSCANDNNKELNGSRSHDEEENDNDEIPLLSSSTSNHNQPRRSGSFLFFQQEQEPAIIMALLAKTTYILIYMVTWVANGEFMQGIANGSLLPSDQPAFNQPIFLSWYAYCFLILCWIPPLIFIRQNKNNTNNNHHRLYSQRHQQPGQFNYNYNHHDTTSFWIYLVAVWPQGTQSHNNLLQDEQQDNQQLRHDNDVDQVSVESSQMSSSVESTRPRRTIVIDWMPFLKMCAICTAMLYILSLLNVLWIMGLEFISVSTSNAVYQTQAILTVLLSWCIFQRQDNFAWQVGGMLVATGGIAMIVLPPLTNHADSDDNDAHQRKNVIWGIVATLLSAILWAIYQIIWKVIMQRKQSTTTVATSDDNANTQQQHQNDQHHDSSWQGVMDTCLTLGMLGWANILLGWPIIVVAHLTGLEPFVAPPLPIWPILTVNALVEILFDISCVWAIYKTSPVVTSVVAPLTIPISILWDAAAAASSPVAQNNNGAWIWIGSILILVGIIFMEANRFIVSILQKNQTCHQDDQDRDPATTQLVVAEEEEEEQQHAKNNEQEGREYQQLYSDDDDNDNLLDSRP